MSATEIYGVKANGDVVKVGETEDAMRGAMYIWSQLAGEYNKGTIMDFSPLWDLCDTEAMKPMHSNVLKTTFDDVVVLKEDIPALLESFAAFNQAFPGSSLPEQSKIIQHEILNKDDMIGLCWNQTSSLPNAWTVRDDEGQLIPYNIHECEEHFVI